MLRIEWTEDTGARSAIEADVSPREGHELVSEVTDHAVEAGADVSDHAKPGNPTLTVEGLISNHPIELPRTQMEGITAEVKPMRLEQSRVSVNCLQFSGPFDRVRAVDRLIRTLIKNRTIVRIITHLRDDDEMMITRFRADLESGTGNALPFSLDAKKLNIVETQTVQVQRPAERRGQPTRQRGNQPPTPTPRLQGLAYRGVHGLIGQ